jgi:UDP-N-acetylmuramate--alanine ligase
MADRVFFMDIYAARESNEWGISSRDLAERVGKKAVYGGSPQRTAALVCEELRAGDVLIVMGAGDLYKIYDYLEIQETET